MLKDAVECMEVGCTACIGFILYETGENRLPFLLRNEIIGKRVLYIANVGDTRAVLGQIASYKRVSYDHKASDEHEIARVK